MRAPVVVCGICQRSVSLEVEGDAIPMAVLDSWLFCGMCFYWTCPTCSPGKCKICTAEKELIA